MLPPQQVYLPAGCSPSPKTPKGDGMNFPLKHFLLKSLHMYVVPSPYYDKALHFPYNLKGQMAWSRAKMTNQILFRKYAQ
jgi:hypothetical protein